jgi:hypothetical protein
MLATLKERQAYLSAFLTLAFSSESFLLANQDDRCFPVFQHSIAAPCPWETSLSCLSSDVRQLATFFHPDLATARLISTASLAFVARLLLAYLNILVIGAPT